MERYWFLGFLNLIKGYEMRFNKIPWHQWLIIYGSVKFLEIFSEKKIL